jgi:hypothetical protein
MFQAAFLKAVHDVDWVSRLGLKDALEISLLFKICLEDSKIRKAAVPVSALSFLMKHSVSRKFASNDAVCEF